MKKRWYIAAMAGAAAAIGASAVYFTNTIMFMRKKEEAFIRQREIQAGHWIEEDFDRLPKENVAVRSPFGYPIDCLFITAHPSSNKWMIFCHGITENKYSSIRYMNLFRKQGFNAVIYDHRRHGQSGGRTSSYGYYEKDDLAAVVRELKKRHGKDLIFGIHGESMGAATAILYGGSSYAEADFYIADCPFSSFASQCEYRIKAETGLPPKLILPAGNLLLKLRDGYKVQDISPLEAVQKIHKPVLFIHSESDDYIPAAMTKELYEAKPGPKELFIAAKGAHAQSYNENPEEYEAAVRKFLASHVFQGHEAG